MASRVNLSRFTQKNKAPEGTSFSKVASSQKEFARAASGFENLVFGLCNTPAEEVQHGRRCPTASF